MSRPIFVLALLVAGAALADDGLPSTTLGVGTDVAGDVQCLGCHDAAVGAAWANLSSHKVLHDCKVCHALSAPSGAGHAAKKACGDCHSSRAHPQATTACSACHDVHGSANAFLVRTSIVRPDGTAATIHLSKPEGASNDGLARAGVEGATAGTGLCEVCHQGTAHYDAAGTGSAHSTLHCTLCHSHQDGFAPGASR
jgi:predicted CXXCH cytochrome family protein